MLKNEKAFTLVEMLFVLVIISILIILIVPNLTSKTAEIQAQGCNALVKIVQTQVDTYYLNEHTLPTDIDELAEAKYITDEQKSCSNGSKLTIDDEGIVRIQTNGE